MTAGFTSCLSRCPYLTFRKNSICCLTGFLWEWKEIILILCQVWCALYLWSKSKNHLFIDFFWCMILPINSQRPYLSQGVSLHGLEDLWCPCVGPDICLSSIIPTLFTALYSTLIRRRYGGASHCVDSWGPAGSVGEWRIIWQPVLLGHFPVQ